ncbi:MAG TPA: homocysteine S-methyltransferase family protein [Thermoanaerobaculia bacterium]
MSPTEGTASLSSADVLLLDAAVGTELSRRGTDTSAPLWSARSLRGDGASLREIHADDAAAGADILTAATFRTHARNLAASGVSLALARQEADLLTRKAVALAREGGALGRARANVSRRPVLVAGSLSPLEDCYRPDLCPAADELEREQEEQAQRLAASGVDVIVVETMSSLREAVSAARAATATGLAVVLTFVSDGRGKLLSGEDLEDAVRAVFSAAGPLLAVGVNCLPARLVEGELLRIAGALPNYPLAAWGNTGRALDEAAGLYTEPISPTAYAAFAERWISSGARIVGGCCGTNSRHTAALRQMLDLRAGQRA